MRALIQRAALSRALIWLRGGYRWLRRHILGLLRDDDPGNDVGENAAAAEEGHDEPHDAHDGHVDIEVLGKAGADAGNLAVGARAHQLMAPGNRSDALAAIGAHISVILDDLTAVVTVHIPLPM